MVSRPAHPAPLLATLCLLLALGLRPGFAAGAEPLVLNSADTAPRSRPDGAGFEDRIVTEAFRRMGVPVRLSQLPSERALQRANQGMDDGNYARIAGLERLYPNLIMVPEPITEFLFTAFTKAPRLALDGWEGLKPHSVALVNGWKIVEANTVGVRARSSVKDEAALFAMLDSGRVEVAVLDLHTGMEMVRLLGLKGVRALAPPLERRPMHVYLHRRHAELVPKLARALRQMKRDGTIERLTRAGLAAAARQRARASAAGSFLLPSPQFVPYGLDNPEIVPCAWPSASPACSCS